VVELHSFLKLLIFEYILVPILIIKPFPMVIDFGFNRSENILKPKDEVIVTSYCKSFYLEQHFLYFFPEPQGQGSFLPILGSLTIGMPAPFSIL